MSRLAHRAVSSYRHDLKDFATRAEVLQMCDPDSLGLSLATTDWESPAIAYAHCDNGAMWLVSFIRQE